ncbi:MAG: LD-carboxypeptidase [Bdellovibrio sp.]|nr:LD-carboxypeptidase [Bdellovibrio sp.]
MSKIKKTKKIRARKISKRSNVKSALAPLQKGDLIEIIAPGSAAPIEILEQGVQTLKSWGYEVTYSPDLLKPEMYLANSDEYRFESFKKAMTNKESKAVWCLRGGYGSIRILPQIEEMAVPKNKKLLIGFSDITSLHAVINQKWKWPSLHASLIDRLKLGKLTPENTAELQASLLNIEFSALFKNLKPLNAAAKRNKKITSSVIGGNLVVLVSSIGTPSQINTKDKIIFLEETGERGYRVDRCLQQMKQAGLFDQAAAVVLGDFINGLESDGKDMVPDTLKNFFANLKIPTFSGVQAGHAEIQRPLFFNTRSVLTCGEAPQMLIYSDYEIHKPRK